MAVKQENIPEQYKVRIRLTGPGWDREQIDIPGVNIQDTIVAPYPDDGISMSFSSSWQQSIKTGGDTVDNILQVTTGRTFRGIGKEYFGEALYTWGGIEPVKVSMTLRFVTYEDPVKDVIRPAFSLAATQMPSNAQKGEEEESLTLDRPVEVTKSDQKRVTVEIGKWLTFRSVFPENATPNFSGKLSTSPSNRNKAFPVEAEVDFEFIGSIFPLKNDFGFDINTQSDSSANQNPNTSVTAP